MSHTDNTQKKFNTNFPSWLALKLWAEHIDPEVIHSANRTTQKRQWRKEIEMESQ